MPAERRQPLKIEVPDQKQETVRFGRVGLIVTAGFAIGIIWPRVAGFKLVPSVPSQPTSDSGIPLIVRAGTPIKVALDRDARIHRAGQPVRGKTTEPIYAFDKLLVPAGTVATGRIAGIEDVPKMTRTLAAMNADFSPVHKTSRTISAARRAW